METENLEMIKWIFDHSDIIKYSIHISTIKEQINETLFSGNYIHVAQWLYIDYGLSLTNWEKNSYELLINHGSLEMIKWFHNNKDLFSSPYKDEFISLANERNRSEVRQWLIQNGY